MSKEFEFIQECGYFYVITLNGDFPAARPFGAMMEVEGDLFIGTHDMNEAHKQLRENGNIQILSTMLIMCWARRLEMHSMMACN